MSQPISEYVFNINLYNVFWSLIDSILILSFSIVKGLQINTFLNKNNRDDLMNSGGIFIFESSKKGKLSGKK